jgi:hypothetical protein
MPFYIRVTSLITPVHCITQTEEPVYRRNQVQEYLVWRVEDGEFDWFRLTNEEYIKLEPNSEGIICSQIFPGLWLDKDALLAGDLAKVLEVLQLGIARIKNESS